MSDRKDGNSGDTVAQEAELFNSAEERLRRLILETDNVSLLKKIYNTNFLNDEAFDRLIDLMEEDIPDACLEVMNICAESKKMSKEQHNKMSFAMRD